MSLSREEILKISELAHIRLADDEVERFRGQMSSVLAYVDRLADVDVTGLEPTAHVTGVHDVLRDDAVRPADAAEREALLAAAPARQGDLVKVKAVFK